MKHSFKLRTTILVCGMAIAASTLLIACGGGGGSSASNTPMSGTIASGAAYPQGTTITVYDKNCLVVATAMLSASSASIAQVTASTGIAALELADA